MLNKNKPVCPICKTAKTIFFANIKGYKYYKCLYCLSLFTNPLPSSEKIKLLYSKDYLYKIDRLTEGRLKKRAKILLRKLRKLNKRGRSLLDIGSGYGFFLDEARKQNLAETGVEPAKNLFDYSIKKFKVNVINTSFENYFKKNKSLKFDFISLIHVIEHLTDPFSTLNLISKHLNENGILYIETPNLNSHLFNFEKKEYTFLTPPDHIFIFSPKSFKVITKKTSDLKLIKLTTYSYPEHLLGIIKKIIKRDLSVKKEGVFKERPKKIKFALIDKLIAPFLTPLLNLGGKGSILELYIRKI